MVIAKLSFCSDQNNLSPSHFCFVIQFPFFLLHLSIFILSYRAIFFLETVEFLLKRHSPRTPLGCCKPSGTSAGAGLMAGSNWCCTGGKTHRKPQLLSAMRRWSSRGTAQRRGLWKGSRILAGQVVLGSEAVQPVPLYQHLKGNFCSSRRTSLIKAARGTRGISARACSCIFKTWLCCSYRGKVRSSRTLFSMSKTHSFKIHFQTVVC